MEFKIGSLFYRRVADDFVIIYEKQDNKYKFYNLSTQHYYRLDADEKQVVTALEERLFELF